MFLGISMACERFMAAIEVMTSAQKPVEIKRKGGIKRVVYVRVWNNTVANLTLMALGSSAPEILLPSIELFQKNFVVGPLGTATIVGSAAYNLFVVIAVSMMCVPKGQSRSIAVIRVYIVTLFCSISCYVWLYMIIAVITPNQIEVWEGLMTLIFFPLFIAWAFIADRHLFCYKYSDPLYGQASTDYDVENYRNSVTNLPRSRLLDQIDEIRDFEDTRREYLQIIRSIRKQNPGTDIEEIESMAIKEMMSRGHKSRAFYRILATHALTGENIMRKLDEAARKDVEAASKLHKSIDVNIFSDNKHMRIFFDRPTYTVLESIGHVDIFVIRNGDLMQETTVEYESEDGTANAGADFLPVKGVLKFMPGMEKHRIRIEIIDDDVFEQDEVFYVRLKNPSMPALLDVPFVATIIILDDDHSGIFSFPNPYFETSEATKSFIVKVMRLSGARGKVVVPYKTVDGSATSGKEYTDTNGVLIFEESETECVQ